MVQVYIRYKLSILLSFMVENLKSQVLLNEVIGFFMLMCINYSLNYTNHLRKVMVTQAFSEDRHVFKG